MLARGPLELAALAAQELELALALAVELLVREQPVGQLVASKAQQQQAVVAQQEF